MSRIVSKLAVAAVLGAAAIPQFAAAQAVILEGPRRAAMFVSDGVAPAPLPRRRIDAASALYGIDPMPVGPVPVRYDDDAMQQIGCAIERSEAVTPTGWRRIVTHRTCYRR